MQNKELRDGNVYLSVFSDDHYAQCLLEVVHQLKDKTICFVTLNKSAASLQHTFLQHNLSLRNVFFIDTVSRSLGQSKDQDNVLYVSSPGSFTELSLAISEVMRTGAFDAVVFDSLSTLTIYDQHGKAAQQFVSSIIQKTKTGGQLGIFTCLQADLNSQLVQKSCMFVDEVVHVQQFRPEIGQRMQHHSAVVTALLGVAAVGMLSTVFTLSAQSPTGFVVGAFDVVQPQNLLLAGLVFVGSVSMGALAYVLHKKGQFNPVLLNKFQKMARTKYNSDRLKMIFRSKVQGWLDKYLPEK
ncbi:MAG TPA: hypothetical protein VJB66_03310 [Candidatus Nanoarchaeia archaeon]|nr:hypothetical protein [Candidatus Nanoarchaeia archaeon]